MNLKFYVDNQLVREPKEWKSLELELNFEDLTAIQTSISQEKFTWVLENADFLNKYFLDGTNGGLGVYWGVPFRVELDSQVIFDGYIDLVNDAEFSCDEVIVKVRENKKLDWMEEVADGFSFELLYDRGIITNSDFLNIPYIQSEVPDYQSAALSTFLLYVLSRDIAEALDKINKDGADTAGVTTTGAGIAKLIITIAYIAVLVFAIKNLIADIIEDLISSKKYHKGMLAKTHFEKACEYLGFTFSSSIFDPSKSTNSELTSGEWENMVLIPFKTKEGFKKSNPSNQTGFYQGTFGDFIRGMSAVFNAKFIIIGNTFHFERDDFGSSVEEYKIPNVRTDFFGTNAKDIVSNYLLQFQIDNQDLNTINRYKGTNVKNFITSKNKDINRVELIQGFAQPPIPFALGRRKDELTRVESIVDKIFTSLNGALEPITNALDDIQFSTEGYLALIGFLNRVIEPDILPFVQPIPSFSEVLSFPKLSDRIGMLALSSDFIGTDKLVLIEGEGFDIKVTQDNETKLSAKRLYNDFHYIESFVPTTSKPTGKQRYEYSIPTIPFCTEDYYKITGVNNEKEGRARITSPQGNTARIQSLKWNIYNSTASISYEEEKLYTNNLEQKLIENEG